MKSARALAVCLLVLVALVSVARGAPGPATQFVADVVSQTAGRPQVAGKVYVDNGRMRIDTAVQGSPAQMIIRPDKDRLFMVVPAQKEYREMPLQSVNKHNAYMPDVKRTLVGSDDVRGQACDKYRVISGPQTFFFWVRKGTSIPVQMQTSDGKTRAEYQNVRLGAPPAGTFEVPAGFKKI